MSPFIIKKIIKLTIEPLISIIIDSLEHGVLPNLLKLALVSTFHKHGNTNLNDNFRPNSMLITFSKIFEN